MATRLYTIGFTKRSAQDFFETLRQHGIKRLLDIRLHNTSHLAGFTKRDDLRYLLRELLDAEYVHEPALAPTEDILAAFKTTKDWDSFERSFVSLLRERGLPSWWTDSVLDTPTVLLCSEPEAARCHRRLAAEYVSERLGNLEIVHL